MVVKVIELIGESNQLNDAVKTSCETSFHDNTNITGVEVYNLTAGVSDGNLVEYKANVKVAHSGH